MPFILGEYWPIRQFLLPALTLNERLNKTPCMVWVREYSIDLSSEDRSGSEGKVLVILALRLLDPAAFLALTWKL